MSAQTKSPTGWVGWVFFASLMMMLLGGFQAIAGLVAIFQPNYYLVTEKSLIVTSYTAWGWVHLVMGIVIFLAGLAVLNGRLWARILGIVLASLSFFTNLAFVSAYPIWSITMMIIDVLVIYSLSVHGDELQA